MGNATHQEDMVEQDTKVRFSATHGTYCEKGLGTGETDLPGWWQGPRGGEGLRRGFQRGVWLEGEVTEQATV